MLFNSYLFLFVFLPLTLLVFFGARAVGKMAWSIPALVIASLIFYSTSGLSYLALLVCSILFNFTISQFIANGKAGWPRIFLIVGILGNLFVLGYFKYYNFFIENFSDLTGIVLTLHKIALPVGISFFTFTQLAYLVDCHKLRSSERNIVNYALFVTIFPHLIAGPIIHHAQVRPQFERLKRTPIDSAMIVTGVTMFVIGLAKKALIADNVAGVASLIFDAADGGKTITSAAAWLGTVAYTLQIYFDFSGYSDMAIGLALLFGIKLPINFNSPYKSTSIVEFWRRWHMTLSTWLRDYVYIPLGGNRGGELMRLRNVFLTMLIGGVWHGAGWTFVVWGALHGAYIVVNHLMRKFTPDVLSGEGIGTVVLKRATTLLLVMVAWIFFRATSLDGALSVLSSFAFLGDAGATPLAIQPMDYLAVAVAALIALFAPNTQQLAGYNDNPAVPLAQGNGTSLRALLSGRGTLSAGPVTAIACGVTFAFVLAVIWRPAIFIYFNF